MNRDMIIDIKCFRKSVKHLRDNDGGSRVSDLFDEISHFTTCPISPPRTLLVKRLLFHFHKLRTASNTPLPYFKEAPPLKTHGIIINIHFSQNFLPNNGGASPKYLMGIYESSLEF